MTTRCVVCLGEVRRRWWQWGPLRPLPVHTWADAALCRARADHPRTPVTQECVSWGCTRPGVANLSVSRPCGHPVRGTEHVQLQWSCPDHLRARAGTTAPGPSTCPTCGDRAPVEVAPLVHATNAREWGAALCGQVRPREEVAVYARSNHRLTTCPDCLEWLHA